MAKYLDEAGAEQLNQLLAAKFNTKVDKVLNTKIYENILGTASDTSWGNNTFYFASVKPTSFTDIWSIRYRIYVWVESDSNYRAMANVLFMGSQSGLASYAVFNNIYNTSYRPAYYHTMYRLLQAGFNAGYGHAIGVSLKDANAKDTAGKERTIKVELLEQINCTATLLDNAIKWGSWEGANATNYSGFGNAPSSYNFSGNGLQETGDANDNSVAWTIKSYYDKMKAGSGKVYRYNICTYCNDNTLQSFVTSASTGTTKTKNTASYMIGAPLFYFNSSSDVAAGSVCADNTLWTQHSGIDLRYSTNCGATLTQYLPVYLVGIPNGATYTLADTWYTQTLPTTEDGKIYIFLGIAYNSTKYTISWTTFHPIYEYKNGTLRLYQAPVTSSDVTSALGYTPYSAANPNGYTSNTGTITKVQANGTDVASSGTANIPAATTSKYGVTELSSATNSTSEVLAATPKAVKAAYDLAASKGTGTITGVSVNGTSVATSGVANITSVPASILSGAIPSAVTATTQTQGDNSTKIATTAYVDAAIDNLPDPMIFKGSLGTGGTITALPVDGSANIGDTYKVITAGTYASKTAKVGDTFICLTKTSSANTWELIPSGDEPSGTVTSVTIKATSPIAIDSSSAITSSGTRTLSHANSGVTAGNYKSVTVNATGHVTAGENPTTLAGFGITDAKIANGVITLGSNTITPITDTSDKVNKSGDTMTGELQYNDTTGSTFLHIGSNNKDTTLMRVYSSDQTDTGKAAYGFSLKYMGAGNGNANYLNLYSDDEKASTQVKAIQIDQDGVITTAKTISGTIDKALKDGNGDTITSTYYKASNPSGYITNTGSTSGNAGTATKLQTPRTIAIGTGATGTATSFDGSANITIPITETKEAYQSWGGKSISGGITPVDAGCIDEFGHNKLAYLPASCINVAYSTDGGTTWVDYGLSDENKVKMVTTSGTTLSSGGSTTATAENVTNLKLRVRIACGTTDGTQKIYTAVKKILLNVTDPGADATLNIRYRNIANYMSDTDTWTTISETYNVRGGSGWNSIPFNYTFGGSMTTQTSQMGQIELVFSNTKLGTWGAKKVQLFDIRMIGITNWAMPSWMAKYGRIYDIDVSQNATFPGNINPQSNNTKTLGTSSLKWNNVYATTLTGNLTGNVTGNLTGTATKATGDKNGNDITTTYYKASNPNGYTSNTGTIEGVSINGTSIATSGIANITSIPASILTGTVPSECYTDTKNTAGSTDTSSKIYLIGATSQAANPQTYSDNEVYATSGVLTAKSYSVNGGATIEFNSTDNCIEFNFS